MAMIVLAPTSRAPWMQLSPTPPQPMTATVSPASTRAALVTEHTPVVTQQPMRAATSGGMSPLTRTACSAGHTTCSAQVPSRAEM